MGIQMMRRLKLQVEQASGPPAPRPWGRGLLPLQPARAVRGLGEPRPRDEGLVPSASLSSHFRVTVEQRTGKGGRGYVCPVRGHAVLLSRSPRA